MHWFFRNTYFPGDPFVEHDTILEQYLLPKLLTHQKLLS